MLITHGQFGQWMHFEENGGRCSVQFWKASKTWTDSSFTVFLVGSSWVIAARVSSVLLRENWVDITAYYYNGSTFVQAYAPRNNSGHTAYYSNKGSQTVKFYHNRSAEGTTSGDVPNATLWKIVVSMKGAHGSAHGYFDCYVGGVGLFTDGEYESICKNQKIKWANPDYWQLGGTYTSESAFISAERPMAHRGTPISISNAFCCSRADYD